MLRGALLLALAALAGLGGCERPGPAAHRPALWEISGPGNAKGYVFGTVHALPDDLAWQTPAIDAAVKKSDVLVLEIVDPADETAARAAFLKLGTTPGQPPLEDRVAPGRRVELETALAKTGLQPAAFAGLEDWAAALTLSFALEAGNGLDPDNGADRALRTAAGQRPVVGLETLEGQLALFDGLPPGEQRALLDSVIAEAGSPQASQRLLKAWASGDMAALDREAHAGMMANQRLRDVLLVSRNKAWAEQVAAMLAAGKRPFVAVGAAHVAGVDGLPEMLAARGFTVRRVQ